jgi:CheY-like chemotaxis protein
MSHRVAIVDDEPAIRELVIAVLSARGWEVRAFGSCGEAVAELAGWPTDLLIVDVNLPDGSGLELVDQVRNDAGRRVPAIVLSGLTSEQDIARGFAAGAVDFVGKPFRSDELLARCSVHLARATVRKSDQGRGGTCVLVHGLPSDDEGRIFGRFEAEKELGRGGQGCVVLVRDRERGAERVALKVMNPTTDEVARQRFIRETYSLSRIHHPGVAAIRDVGSHESWLFYTMEFVEGPTLRSRTGGAPMGSTECRKLASGLLHALEAVERAGVIHRDLKPENVVLRGGDASQPVIVDFGLARGATDRAITRPDLLIGTPGYLAPEVIDGHDPTHLSDLFSAGLTLRFALVGEDIYPELEGMPLLKKVVHEQIPVPTPVAPDLGRVIRALIERVPTRRMPSAALARSFLASGPQPNDPPPLPAPKDAPEGAGPGTLTIDDL